MNPITRRAMLGGVAAGIVATSGCLGFATGSKSLKFESEPARVSSGTLSQTGYELDDRRSPTVTREISAVGQTRDVEVTNKLATYAKTVDLGPLGEKRAGLFALFTTPQIELLGESYNPIEDKSNRELLQEFQSQYEGFTTGEKVGSTTVSTLEKDVTVEKYSGTATMEGQEFDIYLHITRLQHGDDFVVAIAGYPQQLSGEQQNVHDLIASINH